MAYYFDQMNIHLVVRMDYFLVDSVDYYQKYYFILEESQKDLYYYCCLNEVYMDYHYQEVGQIDYHFVVDHKDYYFVVGHMDYHFVMDYYFMVDHMEGIK